MSILQSVLTLLPILWLIVGRRLRHIRPSGICGSALADHPGHHRRDLYV